MGKMPITWIIRSWIVERLLGLLEFIDVGHVHALLCNCLDGAHGTGLAEVIGALEEERDQAAPQSTPDYLTGYADAIEVVTFLNEARS